MLDRTCRGYPSNTNPNKRTVLLVDDNRDILRYLELHLRNAGLNVLTAENVTDAKRILQRNNLDAVVLDYMLPDGNGVELGVEFLQSRPDLVVTVITGTVLPPEEEALCEEHLFPILRKPFNPDDLVKWIFERISERGATATMGDIGKKGSDQSPPTFKMTFDVRLKPEQITGVLTALADYYRACGGVGFQIEFELDSLVGGDRANVA